MNATTNNATTSRPFQRLIFSELIRDAAEGGVLPVLDLDPMIASVAAVGAVAAAEFTAPAAGPGRPGGGAAAV